MVINGLCSAGTNLLILYLQLEVQCAVGSESSDSSRVFPPDSPRYPTEAGLTMAELTELTTDPSSRLNNQRHQDSNPCPYGHRI